MSDREDLPGKARRPHFKPPAGPPSRRAFAQMLLAAAAAIALRGRDDDRPKPIWIGHF